MANLAGPDLLVIGLGHAFTVAMDGRLVMSRRTTGRASVDWRDWTAGRLAARLDNDDQ